MIELSQFLRAAFPMFSMRGRLVLVLSSLSQVALVTLDAIALLLLTSVFQFTEDSTQSGIVFNATATRLLVIVGLFVLRSALSSLVSWITIRQLASEEAGFSVDSFRRLMKSSTILDGTIETHFHNGVDRVPTALTSFALNTSSIFSEVVTAAILLGIYVAFEPLSAATAVSYFVLVVIIQHRTLASLTYRQGTAIMKSREDLYRVLSDATHLRKSLPLRSVESITSYVRERRSLLSVARGRATFLSTLPRYLLELTLAIGVLTIGGVSYLLSSPADALQSVVLFTGVSFRLLPVINRIQTLSLNLIGDLPTAKLALQLPEEAKPGEVERPLQNRNVLETENLNFRYRGSDDFAVRNITLSLQFGKQYAIVGPSGAGKTTLVDLFLGLLWPTTGSLRRADSIRTAYVPQDTYVAHASLAENVALVWNDNEVNYTLVETSLRRAGLLDFLSRVDDPVPLLNSSLSGGQKQRIGLARALYSNANLIVLDEVTSALDAGTERGVVETILQLRGNVTTLIVAHRLSTVRYADHVFYVDSGQLLGSDSFQGLAESLPQFREQIQHGQIQLSE